MEFLKRHPITFSNNNFQRTLKKIQKELLVTWVLELSTLELEGSNASMLRAEREMGLWKWECSWCGLEVSLTFFSTESLPHSSKLFQQIRCNYMTSIACNTVLHCIVKLHARISFMKNPMKRNARVVLRIYSCAILITSFIYCVRRTFLTCIILH